jgi:hypothetical protein
VHMHLGGNCGQSPQLPCSFTGASRRRNCRLQDWALRDLASFAQDLDYEDT